MTETHRYPVVLGTTSPRQADWFPVDAAKTLSHQDLLGLKFQELGAFWMLRLFCWKDGSVPASPKRLAVLCRSTEKQMERLLERLDPLLEPHPHRPDRLIMPLVEEDRPEGFKRTWDEPSSVPVPEVLQVRRARVDTSMPVEDDSPAPVEAADVPVEADMPVEADAQTEAATSVEASVPVEVDPPTQLDLSDAKADSVTQIEEPSADSPDDSAPLAPPKDRNEVENPSEPEAEPPEKKMSFFMEQESVFDAHGLALCTLSEVRGEPERFKPERHYRMKASRRRAVAAAIQEAGLDIARQAARNLPLSLHLYGSSDEGLHPLDIERACLNPEQLAQLFDGSDAELAEAIRQASPDPRLESLETIPAPWQPPPPPEPTAQRLF